MQLAQAITKPQIQLLERFIPEHQFKSLDAFEGVIIDLPKTIFKAGFKKVGPWSYRDYVPKLAIASLGVREVILRLQDSKMEFLCGGDAVFAFGAKFPFGNNTYRWGTGTPLPPKEMTAHVPQQRGARPPLVLFESGAWVNQGRVQPPVEDPALIQHLVGDLWGVLYTWDLTDMEKEALRAIGV